MKLAVPVVKFAQHLVQAIANLFVHRLLWSVLLASLLLSGCVQYEVGVNFAQPNSGEIVQHIKLGERLTSLSGDSIAAWLDSIESRTKKLQGKAKRISDQEVIVTIPFNNGAELVEKFNTFFHPTGNQNAVDPTTQDSQLPQIDSRLSLNQNNLLLLVRNRLIYDLDLRSLELISTNSNLQITSNSLFEFQFSLNTPWGGRSVEAENAAHAEKQGQQLVWQLQPGQLNHIEAVFWLPNPLGIGTVLIVLFVAAGIYLRYKFMPDPTVMYAPPVAPEVQQG